MTDAPNEQCLMCLPRTHLAALQDCAQYAPHRGYIWKPKTMEKLHKLGLVEQTGEVQFGKVCYQPSAKGRELLSAAERARKA